MATVFQLILMGIYIGISVYRVELTVSNAQASRSSKLEQKPRDDMQSLLWTDSFLQSDIGSDHGEEDDSITYTTAELQRLFTFNCKAQDRTAGRTFQLMELDSPKDMNKKLNSLPSGITDLCIYITKKADRVWTIDLTGIQRLAMLKRLWLTFDDLLPYSGLRSYLTFSPKSNIVSLPMNELYIDVPIRMHHSEHFLNLLQQADRLKVLKIHHLEIGSGEVHTLLSPLKNRRLTALSLQRLRCITGDCAAFDNVTMSILKSCPLHYLDLGRNEIIRVESGFIIQMQQLKYLDFSRNLLTSTSMMFLLLEVSFHKSLEVFKINNLPRDGTLSNNRHKREVLSFLQSVPNLHSCLSKVGILNIFNHQQYCDVIECLQKDITTDHAFHVPCEFIPAFQDLKWDLKCYPKLKLPVWAGLTEIEITGISVTNLNGPGNNLNKYINEKQGLLCFNNVTLDKLTLTWNSEVVKLLYFDNLFQNLKLSGISVKQLDLSFNDMSLIFNNQTLFYHSLSMLTHFYVPGNLIQFADNYSICRYNPSIEVLDLSMASLKILPMYLFSQCEHIKRVDLSNNILLHLDITFHNHANIQLLNISYNLLHAFGNNFISSITYMASLAAIDLDVSENIFHCDCTKASLNTLGLIRNPVTNLTIMYNGHLLCIANKDGKTSYEDLHQFNVEKLHKDCANDNTTLIVLISLINICFILLCILSYWVFKYRYRIKTGYYRYMYLKQKNTPQDVIENDVDADMPLDPIDLFNSGDFDDQQPNKYDAFISYCAEDRFWVHNVLVKELENKYGFQLCIHYRDFLAGRSIADEIVTSIKRSRVVVVVLSDNALRSNWMKYELDVAHTNSLYYDKTLLVVKLGPLQKDQLHGVAQQIVDSRVYIEWPDLEYHAEQYILPTAVSHSNELKEMSKHTRLKEEQFWSKITCILYGGHGSTWFSCCKTIKIITNE